MTPAALRRAESAEPVTDEPCQGGLRPGPSGRAWDILGQPRMDQILIVFKMYQDEPVHPRMDEILNFISNAQDILDLVKTSSCSTGVFNP